MYAYLIVEVDAAKLFVDKSKVTGEVMSYLKSAGIELKAYESILTEIKRYVCGYFGVDCRNLNTNTVMPSLSLRGGVSFRLHSSRCVCDF